LMLRRKGIQMRCAYIVGFAVHLAVEIADPKIFNKFLDAWRQTGAMRYGYLYGDYETDDQAPLGIKAVVKAIYEPPQDCAADGVNMNEDPHAESVDRTAALLGLRKIGWIFLDLEVLAGGTGPDQKYVCSRGSESYFLRSNEAVLAAHLQNMHPSPCKECDDGIYGSKFVTVVVSGNEQNELDYRAYQVSQQGMDLEQAEGILEYTTKLDQCRVALPSENRYVPAIFYQDISEFGNQTTHTASPYFPVDYLVVSVNGPTFPQQVDENAVYTTSFPVANRIHDPQSGHVLKQHLNSPENKPFRPTGQLKVRPSVCCGLRPRVLSSFLRPHRFTRLDFFLEFTGH
jgi:nuclear protein localization family protein 4